MVLDAAGYGPMARLEGIYRCDYTDAAEIPAGSLGYAALAQGLGLVAGDDMGRFAPGPQRHPGGGRLPALPVHEPLTRFCKKGGSGLLFALHREGRCIIMHTASLFCVLTLK